MKTDKKPAKPKKAVAKTTIEPIKPSGLGKGIALLTPKQEKFAQMVASGNNQSDAYRGSFDAENCSNVTINKRSSELMGSGAIAGRIDSLRAEIMSKVSEEVAYEYADAIVELDEAIKFATTCKNPGARVAALSLKQKISGLHVEDRKNERNPVAGMDAGRVKAALEALAAMRKAKIAALS